MARIFTDKNRQTLKNKSNQYDWNEDLQTKNATDSMTIYYQKLGECHNFSFPVLYLSLKRAKDKPWMATAIKQKNILFNPIQARLFLPFKGPRGSLGTPLMISGTIKASPIKLCTVIVLRKAYQNTERKYPKI